MKIISRNLFLILIACSGIAATTQAQDYILFNGGISIEERATAPSTGTKLVFAVESGNYLSEVMVQIKNTAGVELVNTVTQGHWLILNLPNGSYSVSAVLASGETKSMMIAVTDASRECRFAFASEN